MTSLRYYVPRTFRLLNLGVNETLDQLLTRLAGEREWLNDDKFKAKYRMSRNDFNAITEMLETTPHLLFAMLPHRCDQYQHNFEYFYSTLVMLVKVETTQQHEQFLL
jgi:hypothetical protein